MEENQTKKCKYCQSNIDNKAKVCPKCGKKQGIKGWQIVLIVVAAIIIISALGIGDNNTNNQSNIKK